MISWIILAVLAQFLNAVTALIDRHIVVRAAHIGRPVVYAFYITLLSGFVIVIAPFGLVGLPSTTVALHSLLSSFAFLVAIFCMYSAFQTTRASDVVPIVGGISALSSAILAWLFISDDLPHSFIPAVVFLAAGVLVISHFHFRKHAFAYAILSGVCFGLTIFLAKLVYLETTFIDGFFWTRAMSIVAALSLLLAPSLRAAIFSGGKRSSGGAKGLIILNKVIGGVAGVLTAYAVSLGSVAVVNALAGFQFVFLFIFSLLFSARMPLIEGGTHGHGGWHTGVGVALIVLGLGVLFLV